MSHKPKVTVERKDPLPPEASASAVDAPAESADPAPTTYAGVPVEPEEGRSTRLQAELDDAREKYLRIAAEFDNFKKRVAKERIELADRAQAQFVMRMLDVLDDLDRLVAGEASASPGNNVIYDATVLINRKLRKELEASGLEHIDPVGMPFDPVFHEAVSAIPPPDPSQDHTVSATFQVGYKFKGSMVRPARVQVFADQGNV